MRRQPRRRVRRPTRPLRLRPLRRLRHHPLAYWLAVAALTLLTGGVITATTNDARHTVDAWGELERVAVARHPIDPGDRIDTDDVDWRDLPTVAVPDHPATDVVGRVATAPIFTGETMVVGRLAPEGSSPVAAQVPSDRRAVAVPLTSAAPPVEVGDVVDLVAVIDPTPSGAAAQRVAAGGSVVAVDDEAVTVAVAADEVRATAFALATGTIVITLTGSR